MATQRYSVTPQPIDTLLTWVRSGEIAIPEIQRPFVWDATKVRNLLDSLYQGYPVGYLIAWKNPTMRLKDGSSASGKRILIDGQQRITALMASLLGREIVTKDYERTRIRIAFHPVEERFEVANPAIDRDVAWVPDVAKVFAPESSLLEMTDAYCGSNPTVDRRQVSLVFEKLRRIVNNHVGIIDLAEGLDIETVTEIFIRVNSAGAPLSQADFAMSKIAANEAYGGTDLRKAIDYFCHLAVAPEFYQRIKEGDATFAASEYFPKLKWLKETNDDIYDPSYTDMLRVAFTSEFRRGKLQDLVALLSGRNFETKQFEAEIAESSFGMLKKGVLAFMNETHFKRFVMILRSAGFVSSDLMGGQNAANFAYILYLRGRAEGLKPHTIEQIVRRWYVMSLLTQRYSGSPETAFDSDIRGVDKSGLAVHANAVIGASMSPSFWESLLPRQLETSSASSPYFMVYLASQAKMGDKGFLSRDITVQDLILNRSDVHHLFPRKYLRGLGLNRNRYNQIANLAIAQSEINIAIGDKAPRIYFRELRRQCERGVAKYGGIVTMRGLQRNLAQHCIPVDIFDGLSEDYDEFLEQRRLLMAAKIRKYFEEL